MCAAGVRRSIVAMFADRLAAHPRRVLALVLLFVAVAGIVGGPVAGKLDSSGGFVAPGADSERAVDRIAAATGESAAPELVLLAGDGTRVTDVERRLAAVPGVATVRAADPVPDGAVVTATLDAGVDDEAVAEDAIAAFAGDERVTVGGPAVAGMQVGETVGKDLGRAELIAFPLLLALSLLFFRGRATLLPLAVGVTTVLGTFLVLTVIDAVVFGLSIFALNLVIGLGLGLAIDYTLFLVTRYREELNGDVEGAVVRTMRTAGRSVAFSAATVAAALITLTVFPQQFLKSMGIAGATVAIVGAVAALVVSPALLALWGRKLARPAPGGDGTRWWRVAHWVMRRPAPVAAATAAIMLALAIPSLSTTWTPVDSTVIPKDLSARVVADALAEGDGAGRSPAVVAFEGTAAEARALAAQARAIDGVVAVTPPRQVEAELWSLGVVADGDPAGAVARSVVGDLRDRGLLVGGSAAEFLDQQQALADRLPLAIALLCGLTFGVLFLMTGSVVLPLKAIVMNALTVGAALAPLTIIYGGGHLTGLLGYTPNGGVEPSDFLVTAAIVFALSTDYGVFLLARIKELRDGGFDDREAVAQGLARTGRVVTAAAILLAVAIGAFSTSSISFIQQIGVATATGVLVDAFVVRTFLVPSLMALLGRWNWWAPRPLRRLHERVAFAG
jgi:RND superfamily putative drug exporter